MTLKSWILGIAFTGLAAAAAHAQDMSKVEIKVEKVADGVYMLAGQGGNIGLSVGDSGTMMIDDEFAPLTEKIKAAIASVTDKPVRMVVNTHYHGDHTGGNEQWGDMGALLIAQDNVYKTMANPGHNPISGEPTPASPKGALPQVTFPETITFHWNGDTVDVHYIPHAHTNGDVFIHFKNADVIHGGDVANMASYPIIDHYDGGTFAGYIAGQEAILAAMGPNTKLIPGHGPVSTKADLQQCHDMLTAIWQRVENAKREHLPLETVQKMGLTKEFDERWGGGFVNADTTIANIYNELP